MALGRTGGARVVARGWGLRYSGRRSPALVGIDLDIAAGQRVLLAGASGAGKSTLLQALAGVIGDEEDGEQFGLLTVNGRPCTEAPGVAGLVLQDPESQSVLPKIGDDVAFGCENMGIEREEIWRRVGESLALVGLDLPWLSATGTLSGGQKQRLALAGVLAMRPGLLLLDEPTANIDPAGARRVRDAVAHAAAVTGATLLVVEHRIDLWLPVVDRMIVLGEEGGVRADGSPADVLRRDGDALAAAGVWVPGALSGSSEPAARRPSAAALPGAAAGRAREAPATGPTGGAPAGEPLLSTHDLAVAPGTRAEVVARPPALAVRAGDALAVTGPNGSGKTTLALTLGGLLRPAAGAVRAGEALAAGLAPDPYRWRSRQLATRIGSVFQQPERQFLAGTVRGEFRIGLDAARVPRKRAERITEALLDRLGLTRLAEANPYTLSGGQKRRLSVAATLALSPPLLILDEPTFGQDLRTWRGLVDLLAERLEAGHGIVLITHDEPLVAALATRHVSLPAHEGVGRPAPVPAGPGGSRQNRQAGS
ncbi:MAG TPA: ABC transporter ATP-binding protein [Microbacteriaceae bacterium]|nr:ABC transporter ATP-binding protein [Microbacteriaceae bacterium]